MIHQIENNKKMKIIMLKNDRNSNQNSKILKKQKSTLKSIIRKQNI